jgi:hypothetical protein
MTDRELLEAAAKAAGIELLWHNFSNIPSLWEGLGSDTVWNPLADDGDALRLAVKLGLAIHVWGDEVVILNCANNFESKIVESITDDGQASTRRAIVHVAAEIGKGMK